MSALLIVLLTFAVVTAAIVAYKKNYVDDKTFHRWAAIAGIIGLPLALLIYLMPRGSDEGVPRSVPTPTVERSPRNPQTLTISVDDPQAQAPKIDVALINNGDRPVVVKDIELFSQDAFAEGIERMTLSSR
jgi:hypothetical protein